MKELKFKKQQAIKLSPSQSPEKVQNDIKHNLPLFNEEYVEENAYI
jgi:hypothetical protein